MNYHAKWSPSSLPYTFNSGKGCSARAMLPSAPDIPGPAAIRGTFLHDLAFMLASGDEPGDHNEEDLADIQPYLDYIEKFAQNSKLTVQLEVDAPIGKITGEVKDDGKFATGAIDCRVVGRNILAIIDLKTGAVPVWPDSDQLKGYGAASVIDLDYHGKVVLVIHQGGEAKVHETTSEELREWAANLAAYVQAAEKRKRLKYVAGEKNCTFCPQTPTCPSLKDYANKMAAKDFAVPTDNKSLARMLNLVKPLRKHLDAIETAGTAALSKGEKVPGFKLVEKVTRMKWVDEAEDKLVASLGDAAYNRSLVSITAAKKLVDADTIDELTFKPKGEPQCALEGDKRPAINDASADFKDA